MAIYLKITNPNPTNQQQPGCSSGFQHMRRNPLEALELDEGGVFQRGPRETQGGPGETHGRSTAPLEVMQIASGCGGGVRKCIK